MNTAEQTRNNFSRYTPWLWILTGLFLSRIIAQPLSLVMGTEILPGFDSWHGDVLPYPVLLILQLVILFWQIRTTHQLATGQLIPHRRTGLIVLILAGFYFSSSLARLVLGLTLLSDYPWVASPIPAFFHVVLASFLLLYGHFHYTQKEASQ